jgi:predicted RNase H-like HicB family nuclease
MKAAFKVIIERDAKGYYVARVPELHGCHTQARSLDQLFSRIKEAIELCVEAGAPAGPHSRQARR